MWNGRFYARTRAKGEQTADLERNEWRDVVKRIKWHAQELCRLSRENPGSVADLLIDFFETFLVHPHLKDVTAQAPPGVDEDTIQDDDA